MEAVLNICILGTGHYILQKMLSLAVNRQISVVMLHRQLRKRLENSSSSALRLAGSFGKRSEQALMDLDRGPCELWA